MFGQVAPSGRLQGQLSKNIMERLSIAVIGAGISGLSAAWLLSKKHDVTLFEADGRLGGHANTVTIETQSGAQAVDTGFIVYNEPTYPNFTALLNHFKIPTDATEMSFSVSLDGGRYEYSGGGLRGYFGQPSNLLSVPHWRLLRDISHFFRTSPDDTSSLSDDVTLGDYLQDQDYSRGFVEHHILPMASAIWSASQADILKYPVRSFVSFYANHGLLQFQNRPLWRTVHGGSRVYIDALVKDSSFSTVLNCPVRSVHRHEHGVDVEMQGGELRKFDRVLLATHADVALGLLDEASEPESRLLGAFAYQSNRAVLHRNAQAMPKRRAVWASWNYLQSGNAGNDAVSVTYWMNRLQQLQGSEAIFVSLNPDDEILSGEIDATFDYDHPVFVPQALKAQRQLWSLQGRNRTWFCGSYFGYGFHEDGLQAGLAVAEQLGGVRRPWQVDNESARIFLNQESGQ